MSKSKEEMNEFMRYFEDMPDRLLKYNEILLKDKEADPYCYQDTMSYKRLAIAITTLCNLSCAWCYRFDSEYEQSLDKEMSLDTFAQIINNTKGRFRMIHMAGVGEPTMHKQLYDLISVARKITDNVKITTNGTFLTPEMLTKLEESGLTHIEVSIDSFSTEELTKLRGSNLIKLIENLKYINDHTNLYLQINSVVSNLNYEGLMNITEVLKDIDKLKIIHTIPLFKTEQFQGTVVDRINNDKYKTLLEKIEKDIKQSNLNWELFPNSTGVIVDPVIEMKKKNNICFTSFDDPYINVDGYLASCGRREFNNLDDARQGFEVAMNGIKITKYRENMLKGYYPKFCGTMCFLKEKESDARKTDEQKLIKDSPMRNVVDGLIDEKFKGKKIINIKKVG